MAKELTTEQIIKKTSKNTAEEVIQQLRLKNMVREGMSYSKKVTLLLYNYETLKEAVKQKEEDIQDLEAYGLPRKSGSIVCYSSAGGGITEGERYSQLLDKYKAEKKETERDIKRISNALDKIRKDKYFRIIKLKYLVSEEERMTDEDLAEKMDCSRLTIVRNRQRLINKLITILFPQSLREVTN